MIRRITGLSTLVVLAGLISAAPAGAASIWTPVATGTSQTISAIAVPHAGELVFATTGGQIRYLGPSGVTGATVTPANPSGFSDLAMSADGTKGVAVGPGAAIYRSTDSGATWNAINPATITEYSGNCGTPPGGATTLSDDLISVQFADASTVYVTGANNDVLKSTDGGATYTEVNKSPGACKADPGGSGQAFTDTQWIDANHGFLLSNDFGRFFSTSNGMSTVSQKTDAVNGFTGTDELALDPSNPSDLWAVGTGAMNASYFSRTIDNGNTWNSPTFDDNQNGFTDISSGGSNAVVAVGLGGDIYTSGDGRTFYRQVAASPNTTNDWHAVAMFGASDAYVGGANGVLLATTKANQVPDTTAPTGTISGPSSLALNQFGSYSVAATDNPGGSGVDSTSYDWSTPGQADQTGHPTASFAFNTTGTHVITVTFKDLAGNTGTAMITVNVTSGGSSGPSGSGPVSSSTGGTTIILYKVVTVTGRHGRFIPVNVSTGSAARTFVLKLLPAKGKKLLAKLSKTVKAHKKATLHLNVPASVKPGHYRLQVTVFTTGRHSHRVGRSIKQVFVLV